ncbi:MAG: hypothetical protein MZV63_44480 [Marinilabiliales bacterium]|nr:hypothetical protein [Marinilabiliales bacterium]
MQGQAASDKELSLTAVLKVNEQSAATVSSRVPGRINAGSEIQEAVKGDKLYEFSVKNLLLFSVNI